MRSSIPTVCAFVLVSLAGRAASADVVMPGQRIITVRCDLRLGPFEEQALRTPDEETPVAAPTWRFFAAPGGGFFDDTIEPIDHGGRVPHHHYDTTLFAVRSDAYPGFAAALEQNGDAPRSALLEEWKSKDGFAVGDERFPGRATVSESSGVRSRVETWEVAKIEGNVIRLTRADRSDFDEAGEPVKTLSGFAGSSGPLLLLSLAALVTLVAAARRRKTASTQR